MLSTLVARLRPMAAELSKFVVVGGFCLVLDTFLASYFHFSLGIGPTVSKTMSTAIATVVSYVANRVWSFAHRVDDDRGHRQDLTVFAIINVVGLGITLIPIDLVHYGFGEKGKLAYNVSQLVGTGIATVFRFWAYRKWVFAAEPELAEKTALV